MWPVPLVNSLEDPTPAGAGVGVTSLISCVLRCLETRLGPEAHRSSPGSSSIPWVLMQAGVWCRLFPWESLNTWLCGLSCQEKGQAPLSGEKPHFSRMETEVRWVPVVSSVAMRPGILYPLPLPGWSGVKQDRVGSVECVWSSGRGRATWTSDCPQVSRLGQRAGSAQVS